MMALGVLAFVVALLVSVMLHEAGHFATAKLFGMKATQFFVGFGPTLWSRRKGETEYGVKGIPAGGFVKIIGMTPLEEIEPADAPRAFINKPGPQRFVVLVAGSTVHFLLALLLLFALTWGWPSKDTGYARIDTVYSCAAPDPTTGACAPGATPAPAQGVLRPGDVIVAVDGTKVTGGDDDAVRLVKAGRGTVSLTIKRAGTLTTVRLTPAIVDGVPHVGMGVSDEFTRVGPLAAAGETFSTFGQGFVGSFTALGQVPHELGSILSNTHAQRQIGSGSGEVTSVVGVGRLAGEAFKGGGFSGGVATLIGIVASVNLFVGIFNLFPLLPLDGGHVAILFYEKARDWWRRMRKLPAAGVVDLTKLMPLTYGVLALIVGMSVLLVYADIANPVANPFQ